MARSSSPRPAGQSGPHRRRRGDGLHDPPPLPIHAAFQAATVAGWGKDEDGEERCPAPVELIVDRGDPDEPQATIRLFVGGVEVHPAQFHIDPGPGYTRSAWEEDRAAQVAAASSPEVADAVAHAFAGVREA